jgi:hypothetical protein
MLIITRSQNNCYIALTSKELSGAIQSRYHHNRRLLDVSILLELEIQGIRIILVVPVGQDDEEQGYEGRLEAHLASPNE